MPQQKPKFVKLQNDSSKEFEKQVNEYIAQGYKLHGDTVYFCIYVGNAHQFPKFRYFQSLVLDETSKPLATQGITLNDDKVDNLLLKLDQLSRNYDQREFGLPTFDKEYLILMREIVYDTLYG